MPVLVFQKMLLFSRVILAHDQSDKINYFFMFICIFYLRLILILPELKLWRNELDEIPYPPACEKPFLTIIFQLVILWVQTLLTIFFFINTANQSNYSLISIFTSSLSMRGFLFWSHTIYTFFLFFIDNPTCVPIKKKRYIFL